MRKPVKKELIKDLVTADVPIKSKQAIKLRAFFHYGSDIN